MRQVYQAGLLTRLRSQSGSLIPLTIVLAMGIVLTAVAGSFGVRVALTYIQTSHVADAYAVHAAHRAANGLSACAAMGEIPEFRLHRCHDDGRSVELALARVVSAEKMSFEVIGKARIGYQKYATEGFPTSGSP